MADLAPQKPVTAFAFDLDPDEYIDIPGLATYFAVLNCTDPDAIELSFGYEVYTPMPVGTQVYDFVPTKLRIKNTSAAPVTGVAITGQAQYRDNRLILNGSTTLTVTIANGNDVAFGATSATAATTDTQNTSFMALFKYLLKRLPGATTGWSYTGVIAAPGAQVIKASGGAGVVWYMASLQLDNSDPTNDASIDIYQGATLLASYYVPAKSGRTIVFAEPLRTAANAAFSVNTVTAATSVSVNAQGR